MEKNDISVEDAIKALESAPEFTGLPLRVKTSIKQRLESLNKITYPIIISRENGWVIATAPVFDLAAQGKDEHEAIEGIKAMIDDYMHDPDTQKQRIEKIVNITITTDAAVSIASQTA